MLIFVYLWDNVITTVEIKPTGNRIVNRERAAECGETKI